MDVLNLLETDTSPWIGGKEIWGDYEPLDKPDEIKGYGDTDWEGNKETKTRVSFDEGDKLKEYRNREEINRILEIAKNRPDKKVSIPKTLKDAKVLFCRIPKTGQPKTKMKDGEFISDPYQFGVFSGKDPYAGYTSSDKSYSLKNVHEYNDDKLQNHLNKYDGNYGVLTGWGKLMVLDMDTKEIYDGLFDYMEENYPTFVVKSASWSEEKYWKVHLYYFVDVDGPSKYQVKMNNPEDPEKSMVVADLQGLGNQVVGPGSIVWDDKLGEWKEYSVLKDRNIASIKHNELVDLIKPFSTFQPPTGFFSGDAGHEQRDWSITSYKLRRWRAEIYSACHNPVEKIFAYRFAIDNKDARNECPIHSSSSGHSTHIGDTGWWCFGCNLGGDVFHLLQFTEGLSLEDAMVEVARDLGVDLPYVYDPDEQETSLSVDKEDDYDAELLSELNSEFESKPELEIEIEPTPETEPEPELQTKPESVPEVVNCGGGSKHDKYYLPDDWMIGVGKEFVDLYAPVYKEIPKHFLYFGFMTMFGSLICNKVKLRSELKLDPRLYTLLVGMSGSSRKSTTLNTLLDFFFPLRNTHDEPIFKYSSGVGSAEGLGRKLKEYSSFVLCVDEFTAMLRKSNSSGSSLLQQLSSLADGNYYANELKKQEDSFVTDQAYLSLCACTTIDSLKDEWEKKNNDIGLDGRMFVVPGEGKRVRDFPGFVDEEKKIKLRIKVSNIVSYIGNPSSGDVVSIPTLDGHQVTKKIVSFSEEAKPLYLDFYESLNKFDESGMNTNRIESLVIRLSIIHALMRKSLTVSKLDVQKAINISKWEMDVKHDFLEPKANTPVAEYEKTITKKIESEGPMSEKRLLQRIQQLKIYKQTGVYPYEKAKENLLKSKIIIRKNPGEYRNNRVPYILLNDEPDDE